VITYDPTGMMALFIKWWWIPAVVNSSLWGFRSGSIWKSHEHPVWQYYYQFTSNFVVCFAGWCCLYALAVRANAAPDLRSLNGTDASLFVIVVISLTGHRVQLLVGLFGSVETVATIIGKRLGGVLGG